MTGLYETLGQYRQSCELVRRRIAELNDRIYGRRPLRQGETVKQLEGRRYVLYCELAEMNDAIMGMEEYVKDVPAVAGF